MRLSPNEVHSREPPLLAPLLINPSFFVITSYMTSLISHERLNMMSPVHMSWSICLEKPFSAIIVIIVLEFPDGQREKRNTGRLLIYTTEGVTLHERCVFCLLTVQRSVLAGLANSRANCTLSISYGVRRCADLQPQARTGRGSFSIRLGTTTGKPTKLGTEVSYIALDKFSESTEHFCVPGRWVRPATCPLPARDPWPAHATFSVDTVYFLPSFLSLFHFILFYYFLRQVFSL